MTDIILAFVPFLAAVAFFIRARGEQKGRRHAERRAAELERSLARQDAFQRAWLATLAHELRSPMTAILGYGELLEDGVFGQLDHRGVDAIARIRSIADQVLRLTDGIDRSGEARAHIEEPRTFAAAEVLEAAAASLRLDAEARAVNLAITDGDALLHTRFTDACRAFELALAAAIKSSPGHPLRLAADTGAVPALLILQSRLDALRDDPTYARDNTPDGEPPRVTGAALRLGMSRALVELSLRGRLHLSATPQGCTVRLELPRFD